MAWLENHGLAAYRPEDVQRTLLELTSKAIAHHITSHCRSAEEVFLCGGGARNPALMHALRTMLPGRRVTTTETLGMPVMNVEALAFAWLAKQAIDGMPGNLPAVTGARHPAVLGAIYPR
jgi:anhydro-N-acetylmuramic acid kinase